MLSTMLALCRLAKKPLPRWLDIPPNQELTPSIFIDVCDRLPYDHQFLLLPDPEPMTSTAITVDDSTEEEHWQVVDSTPVEEAPGQCRMANAELGFAPSGAVDDELTAKQKLLQHLADAS